MKINIHNKGKGHFVKLLSFLSCNLYMSRSDSSGKMGGGEACQCFNPEGAKRRANILESCFLCSEEVICLTLASSRPTDVQLMSLNTEQRHIVPFLLS